MSTAATALEYASRGWPVFPVHVPAGGGCSCGNPGCEHVGKHPRTQHGLLDATTDEATIRQWWTDWPDANIGFATGAASGIVVLDIDPRHGGDKTLAGWERQHGLLPHAVEVCTGGGGRHIYFGHPGGYVKSRNLAPGIDVKGDGGYVVAAGSLHASGQQYIWEVSSHPDDTPLAPLPEWLLAMMTSPTSEPKPAPSDKTAKIRDGRRNLALTSLAGVMRRAGMEQSEIRAALLEINRGRCTPRLPVQEVGEIARSVSRYAPAAVPRLGAGSSLSSSPIGSDDDDERAPRIAPVDLSHLPEPGPRKWIWEGRIPDGAPTVFYGDSGLAKSYKAQLIANHVARGVPLFGGAVMQGKVLYVDFELDAEEQARRAYMVARGVGLSAPPPGIFYLQPDQPLAEIIPQLNEFVQAERVVLVLVDSFGLAVAGDPTAARDVIPVVRAANSLPCASLIIDHSRNPQFGETAADLSPFGSVYKPHLSRSVLQVIRAGGDDVSLSVLIRSTKANFSALADPLALRVIFADDRVSFEQADASADEFAGAAQCMPARERVLQALTGEEHASPKELAELTGLGEGTVRNQLTDLRKQGTVVPVRRGRWQAVKRSSSSSLPLSDDDNDNPAGGQ